MIRSCRNFQLVFLIFLAPALIAAPLFSGAAETDFGLVAFTRGRGEESPARKPKAPHTT